MNHGKIKLIKDMKDLNGNIVRKRGEIGVITAFLPQDNIYAIMFDNKMGPNNWFRLDKSSFYKFCKIIKLNKDLLKDE